MPEEHNSLSLSLSVMANNQRVDSEEEALFGSYPYPVYFVQSPSTVSHANSSTADLRNTTTNNNDSSSAFHSPLRSDAARFALSRYSSSLGSTNSFPHEKKIIAFDLQSHGPTESRLVAAPACGGGGGGGVLEDEDGEEGEEEDYFGRKGQWWRRYLSIHASSSLVWISFQIWWRFMFSLGVALLVFYLATKPPPPNMSIKVVAIRQFGLGEGVDASGVTTEILSCNCSMDLVIENKSKLFGLHVAPPMMEMSFGNLPLAVSNGPKLYAGSDGSTLFRLYVGTRNKPMYGAGRAMEDMLDARKGLQLVIHVGLRSSFRVVWGLIKPKFHHKAECLLVLDTTYDEKHRTQAYKSSCMTSAT